LILKCLNIASGKQLVHYLGFQKTADRAKFEAYFLDQRKILFLWPAYVGQGASCAQRIAKPELG
jgi:hypothetical protein